MPTTSYRGRRAVTIENADLRVTALVEGGHLAEVCDLRTGLNPLWTPPWPSIEPSAYDPSRHDAYGRDVAARLLAGIMGHNLCLDIFGGPSADEAAAGLPVHGEASVVPYEIEAEGTAMRMRTSLPLAGLLVERRLDLHGRGVRIREVVTNPGGVDRPVGWTQHVTLGPPFLARGRTEFRTSATRSRVYERPFGSADYLQPGADFEWPHGPGLDGSAVDLRVYSAAARSSAYTAHLLDPEREHGVFVAFSPEARLAFGYVWKRADFPWLGVWEENHSRTAPPWNGRTLTRGMEFGVSPFPESRREMIERGRLFGTRTFRWIPAGSQVSVEYWCVSSTADAVPETFEWPASFSG
jgi:hypothetical protein